MKMIIRVCFAFIGFLNLLLCSLICLTILTPAGLSLALTPSKFKLLSDLSATLKSLGYASNSLITTLSPFWFYILGSISIFSVVEALTNVVLIFFSLCYCWGLCRRFILGSWLFLSLFSIIFSSTVFIIIMLIPGHLDRSSGFVFVFLILYKITALMIVAFYVRPSTSDSRMMMTPVPIATSTPNNEEGGYAD